MHIHVFTLTHTHVHDSVLFSNITYITIISNIIFVFGQQHKMKEKTNAKVMNFIILCA